VPVLERIWSDAGYLCGGDSSSMAPSTLNDRLILRNNTSVRAALEGVSLFDALKKNT
jgi:hypothetical protein